MMSNCCLAFFNGYSSSGMVGGFNDTTIPPLGERPYPLGERQGCSAPSAARSPYASNSIVEVRTSVGHQCGVSHGHGQNVIDVVTATAGAHDQNRALGQLWLPTFVLSPHIAHQLSWRPN